MKMGRIFLPAIICLLFTMPARAQDFGFLKGATASAGAGFTFPVGTISDHSKLGWNFTASAGPRFDRFTLTLDFSLHYLPVKNSFHDPNSNVDISNGSEVRIYSFTLNPGYQFIKHERFSSYVSGGYGVYNRTLLLASPGPVPLEVCDDFWGVCVTNAAPGVSGTGDGSITKGGYNAGGGVNFGSNVKFFIDARYHHMFISRSPTQLIPLTFGIRW
jgi:opacity protein-like surface antigen